MASSNYSIKDVKAQHFTADYAENLNFESYPQLLRAIADWIEQKGLTDDLVDDINFRPMFQGTSGDFDDPYYETATVYYREER